MKFSAVIRKDGKPSVSWCPALDVASQGKTIKSARANLKEAVELYFEVEGSEFPSGRLVITTIEVHPPSPLRRSREKLDPNDPLRQSQRRVMTHKEILSYLDPIRSKGRRA